MICPLVGLPKAQVTQLDDGQHLPYPSLTFHETFIVSLVLTRTRVQFIWLLPCPPLALALLASFPLIVHLLSPVVYNPLSTRLICSHPWTRLILPVVQVALAILSSNGFSLAFYSSL